MFKRILLAVDGSEHALHAARKAAELARLMKPEEFRIVVAYDPIPLYLGEPNMQIAITNRKGEAEEILNTAVKDVGEIPCEIQTGIVEGDPANAIIEVAKTRKSDVIVMGSRGLGRLAGLLLGSTSQKVVAHAPCPVLIVR
ncbi:MAG: universal stress protein [Chloroflexi bacterium]|nr:TRAP-T-associated universal stress protein TeaD [Anaerolineales bacterium]MCE7920059.1 universal stress protein [Chloroflexi bacterium CFX1]MCQ3953718.1 universal stress protein [Chloroflexota bacterium]MDL1919339.1 universal stress protein [Chloroflexi bacterium CFX5]MCK6568783.1 universal stress protein [Anaerolineales bacterium]